MTKVDQHFDVLLKSVPEAGRGVLFVTLHERGPLDARSKSHVEVRIGNKRIGQLTPQTSARFLPMIRHLRRHGLLTVCRAEIVGSAVAAEVRIHAMKANEVSDEFLSGEAPINLPGLHPNQQNPKAYDLNSAAQLVRPVAPMAVLKRPIPAEPGDGEVVRFSRSEGRYVYVAVRCGPEWLTTATSNRGAVTQVMKWSDLARRSRQFEQASSWDLVRQQVNLVRQKLAVVRFMLNRNYLAAINIADTGYYDGDWYTTISDFMEEHLPFGSYARWSDIAQYGEDMWIATAWDPL
ncbi:hypothetical protein A5634_15385 [Mycobacterium asiaticum]|uniref:Uncharacterized protein n=1 Tax=Mycobacterium asiaticum TaxID=1790 RepID=A0A1A3P933_MYCAS|nr:hypothetical protein A5634_15385 [Mycobacterium asiaticum]